MIAESTTMIGELETSLGVPCFGFFSNWTGEYSVDADEEAGRLLTSLIVSRLRRENADQVALILAARGGYPAFADLVVRSIRQLGVELQVIVPCRIDGAAGLIAAAADTITMHPQAGIGAVDSGLCVVPRRDFDASLLAHSPIPLQEFAALDEIATATMMRLAYDRMIRSDQRRMAARILSANGVDDTTVDPLFEATLGQGLTVGVSQLRELGIDTRVAPVPLAEQLESLLQWAENTLHLFEQPGSRFEVSDGLADEVEFEPATLVPAAAIIGLEAVWLHELDTGSPDPDAPKLQGVWRSWDPEAEVPQEK